MSHVRQQIRTAAAAALTGLVTTGANIFASRIYDLEKGALPCLSVYTTTEESEPVSIGNVAMQRVLDLVVEGLARATATLDNTLDKIAAEVETALAGNTLGGLLKNSYLAGTTIELEGDDTTKPVGKVTLTFRCLYMTRAAAPETAL